MLSISQRDDANKPICFIIVKAWFKAEFFFTTLNRRGVKHGFLKHFSSFQSLLWMRLCYDEYSLRWIKAGI